MPRAVAGTWWGYAHITKALPDIKVSVSTALANSVRGGLSTENLVRKTPTDNVDE